MDLILTLNYFLEEYGNDCSFSICPFLNTHEHFHFLGSITRNDWKFVANN